MIRLDDLLTELNEISESPSEDDLNIHSANAQRANLIVNKMWDQINSVPQKHRASYVCHGIDCLKNLALKTVNEPKQQRQYKRLITDQIHSFAFDSTLPESLGIAYSPFINHCRDSINEVITQDSDNSSKLVTTDSFYSIATDEFILQHHKNANTYIQENAIILSNLLTTFDADDTPSAWLNLMRFTREKQIITHVKDSTLFCQTHLDTLLNTYSAITQNTHKRESICKLVELVNDKDVANALKSDEASSDDFYHKIYHHICDERDQNNADNRDFYNEKVAELYARCTKSSARILSFEGLVECGYATLTDENNVLLPKEQLEGRIRIYKHMIDMRPEDAEEYRAVIQSGSDALKNMIQLTIKNISNPTYLDNQTKYVAANNLFEEALKFAPAVA
jgi:hypothetical protein